MNKKIILSLVIVLVVTASGSFYGGMKYGQSKKTSQRIGNLTGSFAERQNVGSQFSVNGGQKRTGGGGIVAGKIISKDDTSITVELPNGGSKIVFYGVDISILKNIKGEMSDLVVGGQVMINGQANKDGSVNAESINVVTPKL